MRILFPGFPLRCFEQHGLHLIAISLHQHVTQLIEEFDQRVFLQKNGASQILVITKKARHDVKYAQLGQIGRPKRRKLQKQPSNLET